MRAKLKRAEQIKHPPNGTTIRHDTPHCSIATSRDPTSWAPLGGVSPLRRSFPLFSASFLLRAALYHLGPEWAFMGGGKAGVIDADSKDLTPVSGSVTASAGAVGAA